MANRINTIFHHVTNVLRGRTIEEAIRGLQKSSAPLPTFVGGSATVSEPRIRKAWDELSLPADERSRLQEILLDPFWEELPAYQGNIENAIGLLRLPIGIAGPLRVNGLSAQGDYAIPLATTEAALVASYHRGCRAITEADGCSALVLSESVNRAPGFVFASAVEACHFVVWTTHQFEHFQELAATSTNHGKLIDLVPVVEGNHVYLDFEFTTGDASGQNMVTMATQVIYDWILEHTKVAILRSYIESNLSGDKKASARSFTQSRGKKVTAEVTIPAKLVKKILRSEPQAMVDYWRMSAIGGVLSGTMGVHGHFANGLTALYLATGQDAACVAESSTGVTRFETTEQGDLYATVTLPGIMVGTVGGGTGLPSQAACLELMGLRGSGNAYALAEVCAGLLLAGELSIIAALAAGHFTRAHRKLARERVQKPEQK